MTDITIRNGDLNLAASVYGPEGAPDVLFLHGIAGARDTWEEAFRRFEGRFHVWALDFRGHGHSDRAASYRVEDYASDAAAALDFIRRPTIIVSHSLGSVVGAFLAQELHRFLKAVFMEDPPYYFGEAKEYAKSGNDKRFAAIQKRLVELRAAGAGLGDYLRLVGEAPAPQGGVQADHVSPRHILSAASGMMRQDPDCWTPATSTAVFEKFDGDRPLKVPALILQADRNLGPGFLEGHEKRFLKAPPEAEVIYIEGAPHRIHATRAFERRCLDEVETFLEKHAR